MNQTALPIHQDKPELRHKRILVIEDDPDIAELIRLHLQSIYQTVTTIHDGLSGLNIAIEQYWDLIVLDIGLPEKNGLDVCRDLRSQNNNVPILMLTCKSSEFDRVLGLEMGADDYVTKPFSVLELASRIKAIFRRVDTPQKSTQADSILYIKKHELELNPQCHKVLKHGQDIELTAKEFDLLRHFMQNPNHVFSRMQLLNKIWGYCHEGYQHTVNSHINRLRAKIEDEPTSPTIITTVWGVGYKLSH